MEDQDQPVTTRSVGVMYGAYAGIASAALFIIFTLMSINPFGNWAYIGLAITVVLLVLAQKKFKDSGDGFMSYGQGMGVGFWFILVSLIIGMAVRYVYITFFDDAPLQMMLDEQMAKMEQAGNSQDQIDIAREWTVKLFWPIGIVFGLIGGIVIALIITIFTQKKNQQAEMM